jgi:hypothetical protein
MAMIILLNLLGGNDVVGNMLLYLPAWLSYLLCRKFSFRSHIPSDECEVCVIYSDDEYNYFIGWCKIR